LAAPQGLLVEDAPLATTQAFSGFAPLDSPTPLVVSSRFTLVANRYFDASHHRQSGNA
jgi:hypothetical protein